DLLHSTISRRRGREPQMRNRMALGLLLISSAAGIAPQGGGQAAAAPDAMKQFQFLVGRWQTVTEAGKTPKYQEEVIYVTILEGRWVLSQQLLRDGESKIVYRDCAVYGLDPDTQKLFFHAHNTDGSIDRTHEVDSGAGRWVFEGTVYGSERF